MDCLQHSHGFIYSWDWTLRQCRCVNHCAVLQHKPGHEPPSYLRISINRSGHSGLLIASGRLWWIHLVNSTIMERQFHQRNTLRLFIFFFLTKQTQSGCLVGDAGRGNGKRLPPENWIVHFQLNVTWKIHGGQWQFVSDQHVPEDKAIFIRFWYIRNIPLLISCLLLQIGEEVCFFSPVVQG